MNRRWILLIAILLFLPLMIVLGFWFARPTVNPPTTGPVPGGVVVLHSAAGLWAR